MNNSILRALVDLRDRQIQKGRIQFSNRLAAIDLATDDPAETDQRAIDEKWKLHFDQLELEIDQDIAREVRKYPIFEHVNAVKGISYTLAAKMIAMIDIERADTVSALWRYTGYAVFDGEREHPVAGERLHYNSRLKSTLWLVSTSFLRCNSPYRAIYDEEKAHYEGTKPDWSPLHRHNAALRKMVKLFLAHLWERWRQIEGLPIRAVYVQEYLGHTHIKQAVDFGWPPL